MKTRLLFNTLAGAGVALLLASCATLKPLESRFAKSEPLPLTLRGGKVPATITLDIPAKWFQKKAEVRVTPVLRYAGGEAWGSTYTYQGEGVRGNAITVPYRQGAKVTMNNTFTYTPAMHDSELFLTFVARMGNREVKLPDIKVGEGVVSTERLADARTASPAIAPDKYQHEVVEQHDADILFLIQQAELRSGELRKFEVQDWATLVRMANEEENQEVEVEVQAYASPDGGLELNEKLAAKREQNTSAFVKDELRKNKIETPIYAHYTAQDWEGFKRIVEESDMQDKELVLRVLSMYPDPEVREREIKNISTVFKQLADDVLPKLRRSRLVANIKTIGKSEAELKDLAINDPVALTVDELLYTATLFNGDEKSQRAVYDAATKIYPRDARAFNNLGVLAYRAGQIAQANQFFGRALNLSRDLKPAQMNLGLIALDRGDMELAEQLMGAAGELPEISSALGTLYLKQGKYEEAAKLLRNEVSNNAVLAHVMTNDYNHALELLSKIIRPDVTTHYLKAIIGARTSQLSLVTEGIKAAIAANPHVAIDLSHDREFARYASQPFFQQLIR